MATNLSKDFDAFLKVWNKLNYDRTKEEQNFCLEFKRQIIPTLIQMAEANDYRHAQKKIAEIPYNDHIKMTWVALYG